MAGHMICCQETQDRRIQAIKIHREAGIGHVRLQPGRAQREAVTGRQDTAMQSTQVGHSYAKHTWRQAQIGRYSHAEHRWRQTQVGMILPGRTQR